MIKPLLAVAGLSAAVSYQSVEDLTPAHTLVGEMQTDIVSTQELLASKTGGDPKARAALTAWIARSSAWVADQNKQLAAEETFRASVALPLCQAVWLRDSEREIIARERANPSGVYNLEVLHTAGMVVQSQEDVIKALKPRYVAFRKHPFVGVGGGEGVCVAQVRAERFAASPEGQAAAAKKEAEEHAQAVAIANQEIARRNAQVAADMAAATAVARLNAR